MAHLKRRQLSTTALVFTTFLCVSGGAFGLEALMAESGAGMGMLMILLVPVLWGIPIALKTAELGSAIPEEGGYYVWVKRALGPFPGFLCAWWTWLYSMVDAALYPVLFAEYLRALLGLLYGADAFAWAAEAVFGRHAYAEPLLQWAIAALVIAFFTGLNVRGARAIGASSILFSLLLLAPFAAMAAVGLPRAIEAGGAAFQPFVPEGQTWFSAMAAGMYVAMWNYLGWDSATTVAEEVEDPARAYPRSLFWCTVLTIMAYLVPAWIGLALYGRAEEWKEGMWPEIAAAVGGSGLGIAMAGAALFSAMGLFMAAMLAASRIPFVLAEDRLLPPALANVHPRFGTPWMAILVSGVLYLAFTSLSFTDLLSINVILYSAAVLLQFAAFLVLRQREPAMDRPFRVPGGWPVAWTISILPAAVLGLAIYNEWIEMGSDGPLILSITAACLVSGPIWYAAFRPRSLPSG